MIASTDNATDGACIGRGDRFWEQVGRPATRPRLKRRFFDGICRMAVEGEVVPYLARDQGSHERRIL